MRQMENTVTYIFLYVTCASIYSFADDVTLDDPLMESDFQIVRLPHVLDMGKRIYGYPSQYKRYPLYNFGLGKRSGSDEDNIGMGEYEEYKEDDEKIPELELYNDDSMQNLNKRQRYNFGLGKREKGAIGADKLYNFGLGKRQGGGVGTDKLYNFGLGKRQEGGVGTNKLYNFGLGKRAPAHWPTLRSGQGDDVLSDLGFEMRVGSHWPALRAGLDNDNLSDLGFEKRVAGHWPARRPHKRPMPGRFNFGLGKRSSDFDEAKNAVAKRDVRDQMQTETEKIEPTKKSNLEKLNKTGELESHEIMGHSGKSHLSKRSSFKPGKPVTGSNSEFSRQFRRHPFDFGLGKRMSSENQSSGKINSEN